MRGRAGDGSNMLSALRRSARPALGARTPPGLHGEETESPSGRHVAGGSLRAASHRPCRGPRPLAQRRRVRPRELLETRRVLRRGWNKTRSWDRISGLRARASGDTASTGRHGPGPYFSQSVKLPGPGPLRARGRHTARLRGGSRRRSQKNTVCGLDTDRALPFVVTLKGRPGDTD